MKKYIIGAALGLATLTGCVKNESFGAEGYACKIYESDAIIARKIDAYARDAQRGSSRVLTYRNMTLDEAVNAINTCKTVFDKS